MSPFVPVKGSNAPLRQTRNAVHRVVVIALLVAACRQNGPVQPASGKPSVPPASLPRVAAPTPTNPPAARRPRPSAQGRRRQAFVRSACQAAYDSCVADCGGSVFDYEEGEYLNNTDFEGNCEDACAAGGAACDDADRDERCDEFTSGCEGECDSTVFDYDSGEYHYSTDADSQCEDACGSGQSACE